MKPLHAKIARVLERVRERSASTRAAYLADIDAMDAAADSDRGAIGCSNMAHVAAAAGQDQDALLGQGQEHAPKPNIAIITAYNDMLSAHQPFEGYPAPRCSAYAMWILIKPKVLNMPTPKNTKN